MELFAPDKPIVLEEEDYFQRYEFSKRVAEIVNSRNNSSSIVVGIYGKWGEGKTSVLNFIEHELSDNTIAIKFNPWYFQDESQLIKSFFISVASELGKGLSSKKEEIFKKLHEYSETLGNETEKYFPFSSKIVFGVVKFFTKKYARESLETQKAYIEKLIIQSDKHFVVFIDDIDRLNSKEIQAVFKLVKLAADFPRFSYILAFDDELIATALGQQFGDGRKEGYSFLEKIIQIPLKLPQAQPSSLRNYCLGLINKTLEKLKVSLIETERREFLSRFDAAFIPALQNPRHGIRTANAIGFSIPLIYPETNICDLLIMECVKVFYPDVYQFIRDNQRIFLQNYNSEYSVRSRNLTDEKSFVKQTIETLLSKYGDDLSKKINDLLGELFPQFNGLYNNVYYPNDQWIKWYQERRICSTYYFGRYFSFVVREGDISDVYFDELIGKMSEVSVEYATKKLQDELMKVNVSDFLFKFRFNASKFTVSQSEALLIPIAKNGNSLPDIAGFAFTSPKKEASGILKELITKFPKDTWISKCEHVLTNAEPYNFALEIYYTFMYLSKNENYETFLGEDEQKRIAVCIKNRFELYVKQIGISRMPDTDLMSTFGAYNVLEGYTYIRKLLQEESTYDQQFGVKIVQMFAPTISSTAQTESFKTFFSQNDYDFMEKFIDPAFVYSLVTATYGDQSALYVQNERNERVSNMQLIGSFQKIHLQNLQKPTINLKDITS